MNNFNGQSFNKCKEERIMTDKCTKFESLFIFAEENALQEHIKECENCRSEYEKMNKVSELVQEVKPCYKNRHSNALRAACVLFAFVAGGTVFGIVDMNYGIVDTIKYGQEMSAKDLGFRTDDYGLIMVGCE